MNTKTFAALALLAVSTSSLAAERPDAQGELEARIQRIENGLLPRVLIKGRPRPRMKLSDRMAHYKVPGISIAVVNNGAIEWARGYGVTDAATKQPVTPDTFFQAASISKPVAAMSALRLVQEGKLDLDEDVNLKLKSWKVPENDFTSEKKVTLRGLLTHTAGVTVHGFRGYTASEPLPSLLDVLDGRKPPANSAPVRVDGEPGSKWRYSGGGYAVMQMLVSDVAGKTFPQFMKETVLDPIGMKHSSFDQPLAADWAEGAASAHQRSGEPVKGRWHIYPELSAAGLWTTPSDLARFAIEIQNSHAGKSERVLSKEMTDAMLKRGMGDFGLGLEIGGEGQAATFTHGGSNEGFRCRMFAYQENGSGAVVMTNGESGDPLINEVMRSIAAEYGWPDYGVAERALAKVDPKIYQSYAGDYKTKNGILSVALEGDRIFVKAAPLGPERIELLPESETKFFVTVENMTFTFVQDEGGKAAKLIVQPPKGEAITAERLQ